MRHKKHVVVLMGGMSSEHDVSLRSGQMVLNQLDRDTYKVSGVEISREGEWVFQGEEREFLEVQDAIPKLKKIHPDCVFIALHGPFGEDGRIQGMLDILGIPYTGSGCAASAIAIDKTRSKVLAKAAGIQVADHIEFSINQWDARSDEILQRVEAELGFPCVMKSPRQGSSLGMAIPQQADEFRDSANAIFGYGYRIMVERFVPGLELTCGVLDVGEIEAPVALPVTAIRPKKAKFFDYHAKYTPGATDEITPADVDDSVRDRVQDYARRAHTAVGCRGFSRSDMILNGDALVWLEINTIPGLTETSLYPQAARAAGMTLPELFGKLVEAALL
ncbi:MAG: D-alanine--D-alanine ligase [Candidatus Hydrogenedentales bacterium]